MQLLLLLTGCSSSEVRVLEGPGDPGRAPKMLYPDRGIPPNTTGAVGRCKNSEELYYKLDQDSLHTTAKEPPVEAANRFYTVRQGTREGKLKGIG